MTKQTLDDELASTLDSATIRARIFDPATPDYAFLTLEEVLAAFECTYRTLRNFLWRYHIQEAMVIRSL